MKATKVFDCVEMKSAIQARLRKRQEDQTEEEIEAERRLELEHGDSPVARWWRAVQAAKTQRS